ncbi:hypothetical protein HanRHA438_Chr01g0030201 [Helianthus annuus]|nr:hypothetical protein HanRHA438_Chr01g0030201 [Helianthus annuus]
MFSLKTVCCKPLYSNLIHIPYEVLLGLNRKPTKNQKQRKIRSFVQDPNQQRTNGERHSSQARVLQQMQFFTGRVLRPRWFFAD